MRSMMQAPGIVTERPPLASPIVDLVRMLRPRATLWGSIRAGGRWGVSFPGRRDLLFFRVDRGRCQLLRPGSAPLLLTLGDIVVVRTSGAFALASDVGAAPLDSWALVAATRSREMRLGKADGEVVVRGGRLAFEAANERLLTGLLPPLMHVAARDPSSQRLRALLAINEAESSALSLESGFVVARLMQLLLIELLRAEAQDLRKAAAGLLAGLADATTARALAALHGEIARAWTTAELAKLCGSSRSAFSARFTRVVGVPPMSYLHRWRMAVAEHALLEGGRSVEQIGFLVGFQSGSAFSTAFKGAVGCSPLRFIEGARHLRSCRTHGGPS